MANSTTVDKLPFGLESSQIDALYSIANRALVQTTHMIWEANYRDDSAPTDPKVGGHPAACGSSVHVTTAMHMVARAPQDFWCGKPHMAPLDHALHLQLGVFRDGEGNWMNSDDAQTVMSHCASFPLTARLLFSLITRRATQIHGEFYRVAPWAFCQSTLVI